MDIRLQRIFEEYEAGNRKGYSSKWLEEILFEYQDKIILYGAGNAGGEFIKCLKNIGISPVAFADRSPDKHNTIYYGLSVIYPEEVKDKFGADVLFIITIYDREEQFNQINNLLKQLDFNNVMHFIDFRNYDPLFTEAHNLLPIGVNLNKILDNKEVIEQALLLLEDNLSRETFLSLLRFRLFEIDEKIPTLPAKYQYFSYDIYKKIPHEFFVDCGAFDGDTMDIFMSNNDNNLKNYYTFEPDKGNAQKIERKKNEQYSEIKDKIKIYPLAVLDKKCKVSFEARGTSNSCISESQGSEIEAVNLDLALAGLHPTFIKMDVEGCEMKALKGAENIIKSDKPVLGICSYHRVEDLWEIPLYIKKLCPEYKLYLRSYSGYIEHVCYAVPSNREVKI